MKLLNCSDVQLAEVKMEGAKDAYMKWLIAKTDGAPNFAMRLFEIKAGGNTPLHTHAFEHEVYILEGTGIFVCEGKEHIFRKDYCIFVPGDKIHQFRNTGNTSLRFLCCVPND
ncbi:MAG: cupin domain-containing protein [bacterium]|nr:cupin domain-containing protein [bacterium]